MPKGDHPGRPGKPEKSADEIAQRRPGMARFPVEMTVETVAAIEEEAAQHDRSRTAEIRVLLAEALAARKSRKK